MRAFHHPDQQRHDPRFFLQRGAVRRNYEVPARAASLLAGLSQQQGGGGEAVARELAGLDLGRLTPIEALSLLHKWQKKVTEGGA